MDFNSPFLTKKQSAWSFWKYPIMLILITLLAAFLFVLVISSAAKKGPAKKMGLYQIEVNTYGASTTYVTSDYSIDSVTRCVQFKDMMGLKRRVCDHYTITTYIE
jgi:hypothetical protein